MVYDQALSRFVADGLLVTISKKTDSVSLLKNPTPNPNSEVSLPPFLGATEKVIYRYFHQ